MPALVWQNDASGANVFANLAFRHYTGLPAGPISGEEWQERVHPDDAKHYVSGYLAAVARRVPWQDRGRVRRSDGAWRTFDNYAFPLFGVDSSYLGHAGVSVDVTELTDATAGLGQVHALLDLQLEALADVVDLTVWATDPAGRAVADSPGWRSLTGQTHADYVGRGWADAVHPDDRPHALGQWDEARTAGTAVDVSVRIHRAATDDWQRTRVRIVPLRDPGVTLRGWLGVCADLGPG